MRGHRRPDSPFWVEPESVAGDRLTLDARESHHLVHVFRASPGTAFSATDGAGRWFECVLESADRGAAVGRIVATVMAGGELAGSLVLLAGMPEPAEAERLLELAVPLGVTRLVFIHSDNAAAWSPTGTRRRRLRRIAEAALKQSRRSRMPSIEWAPSLGESLEGLGAQARWLAEASGEPSSTVLAGGALSSAAFAVGPPGGFRERERAELGAAKFVPISLGPSRLSTGLAAAAGLAMIRNRLIEKRLGTV